MMTLIAVMSDDQSFKFNDALSFKHQKKALSLIIKYYCRDTLSVIYLMQQNRKYFIFSFFTSQIQFSDLMTFILYRYLLILFITIYN